MSKRERSFTTSAQRPTYITTLWRDADELTDVRRKLFRLDPSKDERRDAINRIRVWKARTGTELPLAIDSTINLVCAQLDDAEHKTLSTHALTLLYAAAISRFITGFSDTRANIERLGGGSIMRPRLFGQKNEFQLPEPLIQTRHRIVHGEMPALPTLRKAAQDSLDWLWKWYWARIEGLVAPPAPVPDDEVAAQREKAQMALASILKTYVVQRKAEIRKAGLNPRAEKSRMRLGVACRKAVMDVQAVFLEQRGQREVVRAGLMKVLVEDNTIVPSPKRLSSSPNMLGAFTLWDPFLFALSISHIIHLPALLRSILHSLANPSRSDVEEEARYQWALHILCSAAWAPAREIEGGNDDDRFVWTIKAELACEPTEWNVRLLRDLAGSGVWKRVVSAVNEGDRGQEEEEKKQDVGADADVRSEPLQREGIRLLDEDEQDLDEEMSASGGCGWTPWIGRWERTPIGV